MPRAPPSAWPTRSWPASERSRRAPSVPAFIAIPARIARPPRIWTAPTGSPKATAPRTTPTSGSRFRNAPAISGEIRACAQANSVNGSSVPPTAEAGHRQRRRQPRQCADGTPSTSSAAGTVPTAAAASWTAVTATGSRPASILGWATRNAADSSSEPAPARHRPELILRRRARRSPRRRPEPPRSPATDCADPARVPRPAVNRATSTGVAPTSSAAWLTLVRPIPAFCRTITDP